MTLAHVLGAVALLVALEARRRATVAAQAAADAARDAERRAAAVRADLELELETLKRLLARTAAGETITPAMIEDGQLWKDVDANQAQAMLSGTPAPFLVDVRTPQETSAGIIPGAKLIPMDEIEQRLGELPDGDAPILVYCAMGGRSAAVANFLAQNGRDGVHNLLGGFSEWTGERTTP